MSARPVPKSSTTAADKTHDEHEHAEQRQEHDDNVVHLDESQRARLSIEVVVVESGSASAIVKAPAQIQFNTDKIAWVGPRLQSKVVRVVSDLGDRVRAGDTVAMLDSVELGRAKARYLTALARYNTLSAHYERDRKLAEKQITSEAELLKTRAEYLQARAEMNALKEELRLYGLDQQAIDSIHMGGEQPLSRYPLTTPIDGVIQQRDLVPGQTVSGTETPIHVVNTDAMWVMIDAYEQDLGRLQPGQPITLRLRTLPGHEFNGRTNWVSRELDPRSRTVTVRASVDNPDNLLRAGMFGTAYIKTATEAGQALVPVDAIQTLDGQEVVFVPAKEAGAYRAVAVEPGAEANGFAEVLTGIRPGDEVVVRGAFDLKSALTAGGRSATHSH